MHFKPPSTFTEARMHPQKYTGRSLALDWHILAYFLFPLISCAIALLCALLIKSVWRIDQQSRSPACACIIKNCHVVCCMRVLFLVSYLVCVFKWLLGIIIIIINCHHENDSFYRAAMLPKVTEQAIHKLSVSSLTVTIKMNSHLHTHKGISMSKI